MPNSGNTQQEETGNSFRVTLPDGGQGTVKVSGDEFIIDLGLYRENHSLESLTNNARAGRLPEWAKKVPGLLAKIDKRFADERKNGKNPHEQIGFSDGEIKVTDLKSGVSVTGKIVEIKRQFEATGQVPRAFQSKRARQLLGLPPEGKSNV